MRASLLGLTLLALGLEATPGAQAPERYPTPVFASPERGAALAGAAHELAPLLDRHREAMNAPGLSWGVVVDGAIVADGGLGDAVPGSGIAVTPETVFRIASMTKSFTALAILTLRDSGLLSLDDPVSKYVPAFAEVRLPTRDSPPITVRHLLTHAAGFPEDNPWGDRQLDVSVERMEEWLRAGVPFSTPPGTEYEYSNYGFALLGRVVSAASGTSYREYVNRTLLRPLAMTSTYWDARDVPPGRLAQGYRRAASNLEPEPPLGDGAFGPMGGVFTSGRDLGRWVGLMLSAWPARDDPESGPVRRSTLREMQQFRRFSGFRVTRPVPGAPVQASSSAYGYGLRVTRDCQYAHTVAHGGGLPGYGSHMLWLPQHGVGVYVMANVTYAPAGRAARAMIDALAESGALEPRRVPPSAALLQARRDVGRLVNDWHDQAARTLAADNLFQDRALAARRAEIRQLHEALGACEPDGAIVPENWLRGAFRLSCERGWIDVTLTLSPTTPPRVQALTLVEGRGLDKELGRAVAGLQRLLARWDDERARAVFAPEVELEEMERRLDATRWRYGWCGDADVLSGNGRTEARLRLTCEHGPVEIAVARETGSGLSRLAVMAPSDVTCAP